MCVWGGGGGRAHAHLAGAAFGYNAAGVAISINALFPVDYDTNAVTSYMLARYLLGSTSLDDAVARCAGAVAVGWNANIAQVGARLCPWRARVSVADVSAGAVVAGRRHACGDCGGGQPRGHKVCRDAPPFAFTRAA